jgi:hypothetical protein
MCVLIFSITFIWNISHSQKNSARYYQRYTLVFIFISLSNFLRNLNFRDRFSKNSQISSKSVQWGLRCSMRTDGRTDRHGKANSYFHSFANATKMLSQWLVHWALVANRAPPHHTSYDGSSFLPSKYMSNATIKIHSWSILYTSNCVCFLLHRRKSGQNVKRKIYVCTILKQERLGCIHTPSWIPLSWRAAKIKLLPYITLTWGALKGFLWARKFQQW